MAKNADPVKVSRFLWHPGPYLYFYRTHDCEKNKKIVYHMNFMAHQFREINVLQIDWEKQLKFDQSTKITEMNTVYLYSNGDLKGFRYEPTENDIYEIFERAIHFYNNNLEKRAQNIGSNPRIFKNQYPTISNKEDSIRWREYYRKNEAKKQSILNQRIILPSYNNSLTNTFIKMNKIIKNTNTKFIPITKYIEELKDDVKPISDNNPWFCDVKTKEIPSDIFLEVPENQNFNNQSINDFKLNQIILPQNEHHNNNFALYNKNQSHFINSDYSPKIFPSNSPQTKDDNKKSNINKQIYNNFLKVVLSSKHIPDINYSAEKLKKSQTESTNPGNSKNIQKFLHPPNNNSNQTNSQTLLTDDELHINDCFKNQSISLTPSNQSYQQKLSDLTDMFFVDTKQIENSSKVYNVQNYNQIDENLKDKKLQIGGIYNNIVNTIPNNKYVKNPKQTYSQNHGNIKPTLEKSKKNFDDHFFKDQQRELTETNSEYLINQNIVHLNSIKEINNDIIIKNNLTNLSNEENKKVIRNKKNEKTKKYHLLLENKLKVHFKKKLSIQRKYKNLRNKKYARITNLE